MSSKVNTCVMNSVFDNVSVLFVSLGKSFNSVQYKVSASDKPRVVPIDQIPSDLGSNYFGFERLKFLSADGRVVVK
jgi:hypothetical protein